MLNHRDLPDQHPMSAITGLESALDSLNSYISEETQARIDSDNTLQGNIDAEELSRQNADTTLHGLITAEENRAKGVEQQLSSSIDSNHQAISSHISNKNNPHEVTKAQVGLGNVDNTSDLNKPISTVTQTALNGKVDKVSTASKVYGTDASGSQTTYDVGSFGQVDDVQVGGVSVVTNKIAELGTMAGETASDYSTTTQADLRYATASQGALADTALQPNDNITELTNNAGFITIASVPTAVSQLTNDSNYQTGTQVANSIAVETSNRESADNNLQNQIDAIVSSSDVFDIVGTYAELQAYDISTVPVNDIIKVLVDSTHAGAATYYRCVETGGVKSWSYIGSEGASYTKAEADNKFVPQTRTVNNKDLSNNITLTANDVGALPNTTSIPTKTSDLTNDSGYITGITSSDVTSALGYTPYNSTNPSGYQANVIETVKVNGTALTPTNKAVDISVPSAVTEATVSGWGFTKNVGTVTSVNNTQPDANGNVTLSIPTDYVTTNTAQNITAKKTFVGEKAILFKQATTSNKLGFTLYTPSSTELGGLEWRPSTIDNSALLALNCPQSGINYVGFRYWGSPVGNSINIVAPRVATGGNYYIPVNITDGTNTITANSQGTANISTLLPTVDQTYDGTSTNAQSGVAIASVLGNIESAINTIRGV